MNEQDLVYRLRKRAEIRRGISTRKSVQENQPDRIADILEEAASEITRLSRLEQIIRDFIEEHHISCPEVIHQSDRVIENAYELIEALVDQVGYYNYPEEELFESQEELSEWKEQLEWEKHKEESYIE